MSTPETELPTPGRMLGGMALIIIGLLILIPSGLCTAFFGAMSIWETISGGTGLSVLPEALMFGAPFIVVGALLFYAGRRLRKPAATK
jgi:hypothetical protein